MSILLLRRVDAENVALALCGVIERNLFAGEYGEVGENADVDLAFVSVSLST
jgi:hypothetical protein